MMSRKKVESERAILDHEQKSSTTTKHENGNNGATHVDESVTDLELKITEALKIKQSLLKEKVELFEESNLPPSDKVLARLFLKEIDLIHMKFNVLLANRRFNRQHFISEKIIFERTISRLDFLDGTKYFGSLVLKNSKDNEAFSFPVVIYEIPVSMKYYLFSENGQNRINQFLVNLQNSFDEFFEIYSAHYLVPSTESEGGGCILIAQEFDSRFVSIHNLLSVCGSILNIHSWFVIMKHLAQILESIDHSFPVFFPGILGTYVSILLGTSSYTVHSSFTNTLKLSLVEFSSLMKLLKIHLDKPLAKSKVPILPI